MTPVGGPVSVRIRPYEVADAPSVWSAARASLPELLPWMPWCHPNYAVEESRTWLESQVEAFSGGSAFEFAIVSADGQYLGGCGLNQIDRLHRRANLGYRVRSDATRQGVATDAVRLLRDWAFAHTNLVRLEIVIAVDNLASQRVAEKAGALREGVLRCRLLLHSRSHDAAVFSFVQPAAPVSDPGAGLRSG